MSDLSINRSPGGLRIQEHSPKKNDSKTTSLESGTKPTSTQETAHQLKQPGRKTSRPKSLRVRPPNPNNTAKVHAKIHSNQASALSLTSNVSTSAISSTSAPESTKVSIETKKLKYKNLQCIGHGKMTKAVNSVCKNYELLCAFSDPKTLCSQEKGADTLGKLITPTFNQATDTISSYLFLHCDSHDDALNRMDALCDMLKQALDNGNLNSAMVLYTVLSSTPLERLHRGTTVETRFKELRETFNPTPSDGYKTIRNKAREHNVPIPLNIMISDITFFHDGNPGERGKTLALESLQKQGPVFIPPKKESINKSRKTFETTQNNLKNLLQEKFINDDDINIPKENDKESRRLLENSFDLLSAKIKPRGVAAPSKWKA